MANRRQRRRREKEQRHAVTAAASLLPNDSRVEPLVYTRKQAARALGVSLATLDRRVVPTITTVKTEWGARLIPVTELERYLADRREEPRMQRRRRRSGRRPTVSLEIVARIRRDHRQGTSLGEIARRLNRDGIPTGQGGRQWWASTVRTVLVRSEQLASAAARTEHDDP